MKPLALVPFALGALCAACDSSGPPPNTAANQASSAKADVTRRGTVAIAFEAKKPGAKPFPFPLVEGRVGDQPTRFIIDTGATVHAIDTTVAAAANITAPGKASLITLEGWGALPEHAVAVRELPATIRAHGIGGIIAPQLLSEAGQAVVLDLVNHQMRMRPRNHNLRPARRMPDVDHKHFDAVGRQILFFINLLFRRQNRLDAATHIQNHAASVHAHHLGREHIVNTVLKVLKNLLPLCLTHGLGSTSKVFTSPPSAFTSATPSTVSSRGRMS